MTASTLQAQIRAFTRLNTTQRELSLPTLFTAIEESASAESLMPLVDERYQTELQERIRHSLRVAFVRADGQFEHPVWDGAFTVVALGMNGTITAFAVNAIGPVYEKYGENLLPYAMKKAILRIHLNLAGRQDGLNETKNFAHVRRTLPGKEIFLGEAEASFFNGLPIVIGVSGAPLSKEYREGLAPMIREEDAMEFVAGHADMVFAELIANATDADGATGTFMEPDFFAQLRRAH